MAILFPLPKIRFTDGNGLPLTGGMVYTYLAGTSTPKITWKDAAKTTQNTNPVILDARGEAEIFGEGSYKVILHDSDNVPIPGYEVDDITLYDLRDWSGLTATIAELNATNTSTLLKTDNYTVVTDNRGKTIIADATAKTPALVVTLLSASSAGNGFVITVKKIDKTTNKVSINSAQTIDGVPTNKYDLYNYNDFVRLVSDGSNWHIIAYKSRELLVATTTTPFVPTLMDDGLNYLVNATAGAIAINLPAAATLGAGYSIGFKKSDSATNTVTLTPNGSEKIDGEITLVLTAQYESVYIKTDGSNWFILNEYGSSSSRTNALPKDYRSGVLIGNSSGDLLHDIVFALGKWRSADDTTNLILSATMIKRIDANWVAGSGNGGFPPSLTLSINTFYHTFLIGKPDGTTDAGFDTSIAAVNLLATAAGYTKYVRVGAIKTGSPANIISFDVQYIGKARKFLWHTPFLDVIAVPPGTTAVTVGLNVSPSLEVDAIINAVLLCVSASSGYSAEAYISSLAVNDMAPSISASPLSTLSVHGNPVGEAISSQKLTVRTNLVSQIRYRVATSGVSAVSEFHIATLGWIE